jgi:hypothetical protein
MAGTDDHRRSYERWLLELWNGDESAAEEIQSEAVRGPQAGVQMVRMVGWPSTGSGSGGLAPMAQLGALG